MLCLCHSLTISLSISFSFFLTESVKDTVKVPKNSDYFTFQVFLKLKVLKTLYDWLSEMTLVTDFCEFILKLRA